jgi:hypothetical protein
MVTKYDEAYASHHPLFSCFNNRSTITPSSTSLTSMPSIDWAHNVLNDTEVSPLMCSSPLARVYTFLKNHVFSRVKMDHWNSVIKGTRTFTHPPADEYERPDEIQEIVVNRLEAKKLMEDIEQLERTLKGKNKMLTKEKRKTLMKRLMKQQQQQQTYGNANNDPTSKTLFSQLSRTLTSWDDRTLRKSFMHVQDASQPRCFYVKFKGEGVDDHGGPYREVLDTAVSTEPVKALNLIVPCPNAEQAVGDHRHLFVFNTDDSSSGHEGGDNDSRHSKEVFSWGRLAGLSISHHVTMSLALPSLLWESLSSSSVSFEKDVYEYDTQIVNSLKAMEPLVSEHLWEDVTDTLEVGLNDDTIVQRYTSVLQSLHPDLSEEEVTMKLTGLLYHLFRQEMITRQAPLMTSFFNGLKTTLPYERFAIFTSPELETVFCGVSKVNVESLKKVTEYEDPVSAMDEHIQYFWIALESMTDEEKSSFINFCSGMSRLPSSIKDYPMKFKITPPSYKSEEAPDRFLPTAQTCFFSLSLPRYSSPEVCRERLVYASTHTDLMDADFLMKEGDGWENI